VRVVHALPWTIFDRRLAVTITSNGVNSAGNVAHYQNVSVSEEQSIRAHEKRRASPSCVDLQFLGELRNNSGASFHEQQLLSIKEVRRIRRVGDGRA
jgi:hypothetical protein